MAKCPREYDFLDCKKSEVKYAQFHFFRINVLSLQGVIQKNTHCPYVSSTVVGTEDKSTNKSVNSPNCIFLSIK